MRSICDTTLKKQRNGEIEQMYICMYRRLVGSRDVHSKYIGSRRRGCNETRVYGVIAVEKDAEDRRLDGRL